MQERDIHSLLDIIISAKLALSYLHGITKSELLNNIQLQDSVLRRLEIIGEAAGRLSEDARLELTQIPWSEIVGMRNRIIHEYDKINLEIIWRTVQQDLPLLLEELEQVVPSENNNQSN
jgi:uncharacterized protein with HEPN domain